MVELTLEKMRYGGIYDQVGGGLCRYSTDYRWLVPHFEKMLYDNALFAQIALECYQVTRNPFYKEIAEDIFHYIKRDMLAEGAGFCSAEDADGVMQVSLLPDLRFSSERRTIPTAFTCFEDSLLSHTTHDASQNLLTSIHEIAINSISRARITTPR